MRTVIAHIDNDLQWVRRMHEVAPKPCTEGLIRTLEMAKAEIQRQDMLRTPEGKSYTAASVNLLAAVVTANPSLSTAEQIEKALDLTDKFFNGASQ